MMIHNVWILLCSMLVFIMHLGFSCLEAGGSGRDIRDRVLLKNLAVLGVSVLVYFLVGYRIMYPDVGMFLGASGLGSTTSPYWTGLLFQAMFAATTATIVSGTVLERMSLWRFLAFSVMLTGVIYPFVGLFTWGKSVLQMHDFAGSTIVHSVGGWAALAAAITLGPRKQKLEEPDSMLTVIGGFLLWFGWFGFNGGSVLSADSAATSLVLLNTVLGGAAGLVSGLLFSRQTISQVVNGCLGGLVGITAGADLFSPNEAILVGAVCGALPYFFDKLLQKLKLDDPVGAISVHLGCGILGTLAVAITDSVDFFQQLHGVMLIGAVVFLFSSSVLMKRK